MAGQKVKFGLTLSNRGVITGASTVEDMVSLARKADADERWDSIWVGDSILAKPRLDSITLLGGLALQTERVKMGPACFASTPQRPALQLAYQWCCLDFMAKGRTIFVACQGQGTPGGGNFEFEFNALGIDPKTRMKRMEEAIEIMRLVSGQEDSSYEGEYNSFRHVTIEPRPVQQPLPIWVTSNPQPGNVKNREAGLRRVARLGDGWMTTGQTPETVAAYLADIRRYAAEQGRALPDDFEVAIYYNINVNEDRDAALAESKKYLDAYYTVDYQPAFLNLWVAMGTPDQCIGDIQRYIDAGATTITLRLVGYDQEAMFRRVTDEVLPAFG
jgi:alkanesulfonate monooxygenase SsuD/methylene tetrahydromethanopterin reductase-like flavin-dependent oxidoreductase (luciferase family)